MPTRSNKLQRWIDLLAALLRRRYPATFEELAPDIPEYCDTSRSRDAVMRMFERDKDELRAFGIAIETVPFDEGEAVGYKLDRQRFYLPYLSLATGGRKSRPALRGGPSGLPVLPAVEFEPDELAVIVAAAQRVMSLGDPVLREEAESALKKISFDLPLETLREREAAPAYALAPPAGAAAARTARGDIALMRRTALPMRLDRFADPPEIVFGALQDALSRRKRVSFDYHTMSTDRVSYREAEPYGLFFLASHWYLAARDVQKNDLRNFRLNRISNVRVNTGRAQSADYEIPGDFDLRTHARSRQSWELGDGSAVDAIVDFTRESGASAAAARLGVAVEGAPNRRKFQIRRLDTFARWLLSFGGQAIPVAPEELVREFRRELDAIVAIYSIEHGDEEARREPVSRGDSR